MVNLSKTKSISSTSLAKSYDSKYICIECCHPIDDLFKIYKDGFKDIVQCPRCQKLVDTYIECENSLVLIDLILFNQKAYRHLIVNKRVERTSLLKFLIMFLLCDAYLQWFHFKNRQFESIRSNDHQLFYELEWNFYTMLVKAIIHYLIYACVIALVCFVMFIFKTREHKNTPQVYWRLIDLIFKSLVVSSFGKLAVVPLVIWNPNEVFFSLANIFTILSNSQALTGNTTLSFQIDPILFAIKNIIILSFNKNVASQNNGHRFLGRRSRSTLHSTKFACRRSLSIDTHIYKQHLENKNHSFFILKYFIFIFKISFFSSRCK